jgi:hypothetical protein
VKELSTTTTIRARPEAVWAILTDGPGYRPPRLLARRRLSLISRFKLWSLRPSSSVASGTEKTSPSRIVRDLFASLVLTATVSLPVAGQR